MPVTFSARGPIALPTGGAPLDPATTAWVAAVQSDGGTVSPTQQGYVDTLIKGLKTDFSVLNLNTVFDRIWLYAGESDAHQAKIDIVNLQPHKLIGSPTLATAGYTGSTNNAINSNFIPNTSGVNYVRDSASVGVYQQTNTVSAAERFGSFNGAETSLVPQNGSSFHTAAVNGGQYSPSDSSGAAGLFVATRTGSTAQALYKNTVSLGTDTSASTGLDTVTLGILCRGLAGTVNDSTVTDFDTYAPVQVSAAIIAGGLNSTQVTNLYNRIQAYMTSWGVNV